MTIFSAQSFSLRREGRYIDISNLRYNDLKICCAGYKVVFVNRSMNFKVGAPLMRNTMQAGLSLLEISDSRAAFIIFEF